MADKDSQTRTRTLVQNSEIRAVDGAGNERRFILSFSSERPYTRWFTPEILDHSAGSVDLTRLNEIGCLLYNHDRDAVIGKIKRAWIENNRGCAEVEFDPDERSEQVFQKVKSGTLKGVSVGYRVDSVEEVQPGKTSKDGRFTGPADVVRTWTPLEISIVSVPADESVGVGRSIEESRGVEKLDENQEVKKLENPPEVEKKAEPVIDLAAELANERARLAEISAMCREFDLPLAEEQRIIKAGLTKDQASSAVLEYLKKNNKPLETRVSVGENTGEEDYRRDAVNGLLMRGGINVEKASDGARQLSHLSMRDLAIECLEREDVKARRMGSEEVFDLVRTRQYYNPTAAFPAILDTAINKAYVEGHKTVAVTFDRWTKRGSLKDFKPYDNYYLAGPVGDFLEVPEGGELKNDLPRDAKRPTRRLKTFGKQFTLTRQAFINDDIDLVTRIPAQYAAAARKTINRQCYEILIQNPEIYDGLKLFAKAHANLMPTGTGVTQESLQAMMLALSTQKDEFDQAIIVRPAALLVPMGMESELKILFNSPTINTPGNTQAANPFYNIGLEIIPDPTINALAGWFGKVMPWWLVGNRSDTDFIEVDYLNGQEIPTIRRMESPGQLGFVWDIWLDWGVSVMDFRGAIKNPGITIKNPVEG